ncbi:MAG: ATP synthase F1 subunit epsilon [Anaerolineales bacterium]|nr:ATP synthase F1 subunit epsilon [Anaerolineales bacterium]
MPIRCEIVSQDRMVFEGDVDIVVAPSTLGEMGILPNHAPLIAILDFGVLKVRYQGREELFTVAGGILEVQPDIVIVLADVAENVREIDIARAEAAKERAENYLAEGAPLDADAYLRLEAALRRSKLRLDAVRRYRRGQRSPIQPMLEDDTPRS